MLELNRNIKEIHIYSDLCDMSQVSEWTLENICLDFKSSMNILYNIENNEEILNTTQITFLKDTFFFIDNGVKVFLHHNGREYEIKEHMKLPNSNKDLRFTHNVLNIFLSGLFD